MLFAGMCSIYYLSSFCLYSRNKGTQRVSTKSKSLFYLLCFFLSRLTKSGSTDSLLSQASGSSGSHYAVAVTRKRSERSVSLASMPSKQPGQPQKVIAKVGSAGRASATESDTPKPAKESRSQKHTRVKVYVVCFVKKNLLNFFPCDLFFFF